MQYIVRKIREVVRRRVFVCTAARRYLYNTRRTVRVRPAARCMDTTAPKLQFTILLLLLYLYVQHIIIIIITTAVCECINAHTQWMHRRSNGLCNMQLHIMILLLLLLLLLLLRTCKTSLCHVRETRFFFLTEQRAMTPHCRHHHGPRQLTIA